MSDARDADVLVVGGGPVGLALALDLCLRGLTVVLAERRDGVVRAPRMGYINPRTMEYCRRWGIAASILRRGWPNYLPRSIHWLTSLTGYKIASLDYPAHDDLAPLPYTPYGGRRCSQLFFDPLLQERLRAEAGARILLRTEAHDLRSDAAGVLTTLTQRDTGAVTTVRTRFAVACDGADSPIRAALGIALLGSAPVRHSTNVVFRSPNIWRFLKHGPAPFNLMVGPSGQWANLVNFDGDTLWRISLTVSDPARPFSEAEVKALINRAVGKEVEVELFSVLPWERRDRIAARFRHGNIFLAGDAAHIMPPSGGLGMNTGMGDAIDLSWKLAAVVRGWAPDALLDSYDLERRPVVLANTSEAVNENSTKVFRLPSGPEICDAGPAGAALRARLKQEIETNPVHRLEYEQEATVLGGGYRRSPLLAAGGADSPGVPDTPPPRRDDRSFVQEIWLGGRAPHAWLRDGSSTLDSYWDGFALVRAGAAPGDAAELARAAQAGAIPLHVHDWSDEAAATAVIGRRWLLVRPDGHIGWIGAGAPDAAEAARILRAVTGRNLVTGTNPAAPA